jgi:hypothetical protein
LTPPGAPAFHCRALREPRSPVRPALLLVAALAASFALLRGYGAQYPVTQWLLWRVLGYWALALGWGAGCLGVGLEIAGRVAPRQYRATELPFVAFPLGLLAFTGVVFVAGLLHGLGTPFFVLAPLAFLGAGSRALVAFARRRVALARRAPWQPSRGELALVALGAGWLLLVYLPVLTPYNLQHDARWYHLPIAQQYASQGAITRFPEGWFLGAYPQLASLLYTWAFLLPAGIVHRIELAAHLEVVVFGATLFAIPSLLRRAVPGTRVPLAWVGLFLFPGLFVYDSNLSVGADHIAAVFATGGLLALYPALRTGSPRHAALVGAFAAGAALTKYSAVCVALPLVAAVGARAAWVAVRRGDVERAGRPLVALVATFAVVWAPHWLKNFVWYGNPLYPIASDHFASRPWDGQASSSLSIFMQWGLVRPTQDLSGLLESLRTALTLGFSTYDQFPGDAPAFGFLFAATLYCLPFTRPRWRVALPFALGLVGTFVWYFTNHHVRYLQACLPWLVVAALSVLVPAYRSGGASRLAACALVAVQLVTGAGLYLRTSYFMVPGEHPLVQVMKLVEAGYRKQYAERFAPHEEWNFEAWTKIGQQLPKGARVLIHEDRLWIGLDRPVVVDEPQWQAGIRYVALGSAAEVFDVLARYGVSHVVTGESHWDGGSHGITGNLVFLDFVTAHAKRLGSEGKLTLWEMPKERPAATPLGAALLLTCNQNLDGGLFDFPGISSGQPLVKVLPKTEVPTTLLERAAFVVFEDACGYSFGDTARDGFAQMGTHGSLTFFRREAASAGPNVAP